MSSQPGTKQWKQARKETRERLSRKLPIVILISLACFALYHLGQYKESFDKGRSAPIVLDGLYKGALKSRLKDEDFKLLKDDIDELESRRFADGEQFIAALQSQISLKEEQDVKKVTQSTDASIVTFSLERLAAKLKDPSLNAVERVQAEREYLDKSTYLSEKKYLSDGNVMAIKAAEDAAAAKQSAVSRLRSEVLEEIKPVDNEKPPLYAFFEPVLDERRSLYVVYQIFYVTLVVILVCGLVATIGLLLRRLFFAGSADALNERAKELLTTRAAAGATPDIMRTVMLSVAALGVGTAVAAAGAGINNKADRALAAANDTAYYGSNRLPRGKDARGDGQKNLNTSGGDTGRGDTNLGDTNTSTDEHNVTNVNQGGQPATYPTPQVYVSVPVPTPQVSVERVMIRPIIYRYSVPVPVPVPTPQFNLTVDVPRPLVVAFPAANSPSTSAISFTPVIKGLEDIKGEVQQLRQDYPGFYLRPEKKNFFSRVGDFFSADDHHMVTPQSFASLSSLLKDTKNDLLISGLKSLRDNPQPPQGEKKFIQAVTDAMLAKYKEQKTNAAELPEEERTNLKLWKDEILRQTRVPH